MKQKKRAISIILCLTMLLTIAPFSMFSSAIDSDNAVSAVPGDVNGDGVVDGKDSTRLLQHLAGWDVDINFAAADCNGDGTVDGKDSTRLLQYLAEWDVTLENNNDSSESVIAINDDVLIYDEDIDLYKINGDFISGTADEKIVSSINFEITDDKKILICKGDIVFNNGEWSFDNFSLRDGENILTVFAYSGDNVVGTVSVHLYSAAFINAENSVIDLNSDKDGDGLIDYLEEYYGSDPELYDTDGDGLSDYTEIYYLGYDPRNRDTDNNGVFDINEDADGDGLTNLEEQNLGTNPSCRDSDNDSVSDYDEINVYKTNPLESDTDKDGVNDGVEIELGTDPLSAETSFSQIVEPSSVSEYIPVTAGATISTDAAGAGSLTVEEVESGDNPFVSSTIPGYMGPAYNFSSDGNFSSAQISFKYDESIGVIGDDFQPRIYYVNEETGELEELEDQSVENGAVTASVEHFSTYILLNKIEYEKIWNKDIKTPTDDGSGFKNLLISFIIDSSGSMSSNDPSGLRKELTKNFIDKMTNEDQASVIDFDSYANINSGFTYDKDLLKSSVDKIDAYGGTCMYRGLSQSLDLFKNLQDSSEESLKIMFLLTDGDDDELYYSESEYMTLIDDCVANGIQIYTIGLSNGANAQLLKEIADRGNGKYYFAESDLDLNSGFDSIRQETIDYITDSNNDGISDYYTKLIDEGTLVLSNGSVELFGVLSLYGEDSDDWDGDGLKNGEEIEIVESSRGVSIKMKSNPIDPDTDHDKFPDKEEVKDFKTDPLVKTYYGGAYLKNLTDDGMYSYEGDHNLFEDITLNVYFDKKKNSKAKFADFFYKYASQASIDANQEAIEKAEILSSISKTYETLTKLAKLGKTVADLSDKYEPKEESENFKDSIKNIESCRKTAAVGKNKPDKDNWEKLAEKEKDILDIVTSWDSYLSDLKDNIEEKKNSVSESSLYYDSFIAEINADAEVVESALGAVKDTVGLFTLWKAGGNNTIKKSLTKASEYTAKTASKNGFSLDKSDAVDVGFAIADYVGEVMEAASTYAKVQANAEAFTDYYDLLYYIISNSEYDYVCDSAREILDLAIGGSAEFWYQLSQAAASQSLKDFLSECISLGLSSVSKANPVIAVLKTILDVVVGDMNASFKTIIDATATAAITDACNYYISTCSRVVSDQWYEVSDETMFNHYLLHLVHGRVDNEDIFYSYVDDLGLISGAAEGWRFIFTGENRIQQTKDACKERIQLVYKRANKLGVEYSKKLPFYSEYHSLTF